jgi:hypothetical protein
MDGIPSLWDPKKDRIDKWLKADNTQIIALENQLEEEQAGKDSLALKKSYGCFDGCFWYYWLRTFC